MLLLVSLTYLSVKGIGIWGNNIPVGWAFDITNFVWWIGIGHAGTLISAILLLLKQTLAHLDQPVCGSDDAVRRRVRRHLPAVPHRSAVARLLAASLPEHDGRLAAVQKPAGLGRLRRLDVRHGVGAVLVRRPRARSRDAARSLAVEAGPRHLRHAGARLARLGAALASLRDGLSAARRALRRRWSSRSTRSSASTSRSRIVPGWHTTIFPPYFVAGAIYSGFAMVLTLAIPIRAIYGLQDFITLRHLQNMAKVMLVTGLIVAYGYMVEAFIAWYGGNAYEGFMIWNRMTGPYAPFYWALISATSSFRRFCGSRSVRTNVAGAVRGVADRQRRHVARALHHHRHQPAPRLPAVVVGVATSDPTAAFGANLLGSLFGGTLEYLALLTGYQALLLVVAVLYVGACVAMRFTRRGSGDVTSHEPLTVQTAPRP